MRDNPLHLALDGSNPLELLTQESRELGREVDHPALIVLRGPGIQAEGARLNVELAALEPEDLLDAPAVRVRDRHRGLEVGRESAAHRPIRRPLKEVRSDDAHVGAAR